MTKDATETLLKTGPAAEYFLFDNVLCTKEGGAYLEIQSITCHGHDGRALTLKPVVVDGHLVMVNTDRSKAPVTVKRIPTSEKLIGLRLPDGYRYYESVTVPFVLSCRKRAP